MSLKLRGTYNLLFFPACDINASVDESAFSLLEVDHALNWALFVFFVRPLARYSITWRGEDEERFVHVGAVL